MGTASFNQYIAYFEDGRATPVEEWGTDQVHYSTAKGGTPLVFDHDRQGLYDARQIPGFLRIESMRDFTVSRRQRPTKTNPFPPRSGGRRGV
jgi:hypothetical protein